MNLHQLRYDVPCYTHLVNGKRVFENISANETEHPLLDKNTNEDVLGFLAWSEAYYYQFVDLYSCFRNIYSPEKFENMTPPELHGLHIDIEFYNGEVAVFKVFK